MHGANAAIGLWGQAVEISFVHLSDIHFRKTSGSSVDIDADLRNAILTDVKTKANVR